MGSKQSIADFLQKHAQAEPVSFHMPGHKGAAFYRENGYGVFLDRFMDWDITEIPGADNLFQTESIIAETMNRYKAMYGAKESYLLINGSSAGLIAAIMTAVPRGGKLIMARNCHKSVFNGVMMAGGQPVYAQPELIEEYGISGEITQTEIARCLHAHPDSSAVLLTSPNYYGICSDIGAIAETVHQAGKILIVDQAHGAHLKFFDSYGAGDLKAAENLGADIVINSTHKTLASLTQSAIVNLCTDRVDKYVFEEKLQMIESTSPSYLLMASLDINADILEKSGGRLIRQWAENLQYFYGKAAGIEGLRIMKHRLLDDTKINLDMSAYGISGLELEELLMARGIFVELVTGDIVMCMTGIGNKRCDYEKLITALKEIADSKEIAAERTLCGKEGQEDPLRGQNGVWNLGRAEQRQVPLEKERVLLSKAAGRVCAVSVIPYPPGIPMVCPGEVIDEETVRYVTQLREAGEKVIGVDELGRVVVGKE